VIGIGIGVVRAGAVLAILPATGAIDPGQDDEVDTRDIELPDEVNGMRADADLLRESGQGDQADVAARANAATTDEVAETVDAVWDHISG
jgi:hypothetical protein